MGRTLPRVSLQSIHLAANPDRKLPPSLTKLGVWEDDKQVDELHVRKRYGERDEIHIGIELRGP